MIVKNFAVPAPASAANDNQPAAPALSMGRSLFAEDAVARIWKPARSVMTLARGGTGGWRLTFERRTPPFVEPLMGWTGGRDTLVQVELSFPTLNAAIAYAERQGLAYSVLGRADRRPAQSPAIRPRKALQIETSLPALAEVASRTAEPAAPEDLPRRAA
ncbi:NADH dehydrogenase ubiquinone Fe-S protein 4 [Chelativorans sp.]|uniref:NADH dehydrogenase ubiquinone Fe-S protein 4 n=1 Tax=Chelativorans sp. TaxID=2203393 RepID=UPI0028122918|nr:NADH dehydrogenase ubiquinone Fe-S protein 4 [Chelativorans sp.]